MPHVWRVVALLAVVAVTLSGCFGTPGGDSGGSTAAPDVGACRVLTPEDVARPTNDTTPEACTKPHTAQTYAVDSLPARFAHASYDDGDVAAYAYRTCTQQFMDFTGADESLAMRTILGWAWFRPSPSAWQDGARWYRCDVVGGGDHSTKLVDLPKSAKGVLLGIPSDKWMSCVNGPSVTDAVRVPCTDKHNWRAVTTIVVGQPKQKYPGDRLVEVQTRDYCSDSVGAWLNYPIDYKYAYTWFHKNEWLAGNRRSICWAGTKQ
jgi:hypothetical protein